MLVKHSSESSIEISNFVDLGILPLNLNMLKKDVGLFNIVFNAGLYRKFVNDILKVSSEEFGELTTEESKKEFGDYL